jgi:hypothetical protein
LPARSDWPVGVVRKILPVHGLRRRGRGSFKRLRPRGPHPPLRTVGALTVIFDASTPGAIIQLRSAPQGGVARAPQPLKPQPLIGDWGGSTFVQMVDLSGHHSNPPAPLEALLDGTACDARARLQAPENGPTCAPGAPGEAVGAAHPRQGRIIDAVSQVLSEEGDSMPARDVHAQVEALLGEPVRWASVKATLAGNLNGPAPRFVRVARGQYAVRRVQAIRAIELRPTSAGRPTSGPRSDSDDQRNPDDQRNCTGSSRPR